jgi:drug/metabolite transporter (DMT)-like permease
MSLLALALVLTSAVLHAIWNYFAKRARGGAAFTWLFSAVNCLIYLPLTVAFWYFSKTRLEPLDFVFFLGSAVLHLFYFLSLQRGYRSGDLSLVYPLARGSGPLLATLGAILFLAERPSSLALLGTVLIVLSVFILTGGFQLFQNAAERQAIVYGLMTGVFIAAYTVWDGYAMSVMQIPPLIFSWFIEMMLVGLLTPVALNNWPKVRLEWREQRSAVLVIAILSPLAYILVLTALAFTPVSYIAPAREISILLGALLGARLLSEAESRRRLLAASGMVLGVILLALG